MNRTAKLESYRNTIWRLEKKIDQLKDECELLKYELGSIEKDNSGVEAAPIDSNRILDRRGSKAKKLALAKIINKKATRGNGWQS